MTLSKPASILSFSSGLLIGLLTGFFVTATVALLGWGLAAFKSIDEDSVWNLAAMSWGTRMGQTKPWYQARVLYQDTDKNGEYEVSAEVYIGPNYFHPLNQLGTAKNLAEVIEKFGQITWLSDRVTIGGSEGVKATLLRSELERHR